MRGRYLSVGEIIQFLGKVVQFPGKVKPDLDPYDNHPLSESYCPKHPWELHRHIMPLTATLENKSSQRRIFLRAISDWLEVRSLSVNTRDTLQQDFHIKFCATGE